MKHKNSLQRDPSRIEPLNVGIQDDENNNLQFLQVQAALRNPRNWRRKGKGKGKKKVVTHANDQHVRVERFIAELCKGPQTVSRTLMDLPHTLPVGTPRNSSKKTTHT